MIDSGLIYRKAESLKDRFGSNNPMQISRELGIHIYYEDFEILLGMYSSRWKRRAIYLNNNLEDPMRRMVLAHELGHDVFHRDLAKKGLKEFALFNLSNIAEYEANAFAAHLLLEDCDVLELAKAGCDVAQIASSLNSHINLLLIKLQEMNRLGRELRLPCEVDGSFFKKVRV